MVDDSEILVYSNKLGKKHQLIRLVWNIVWIIFARPFPRRIGNKWNLILLRFFGAKIDSSAVVYSSCKVYLPSNLVMKANSCLGPEVNCYNVDKVTIGLNVTISQRVFICGASHDIRKKEHPLITAPINFKDNSWVGAEAFIGMGVSIGKGAVVGARAAVFKNVDDWSVVGGNPAKFLKKREFKND
ncbi:putative colanic acid biosynthesis acetyltransferase [Maribacter sp. LLG6340-A2]|uniref:putative colanic acid biosynthesis acetyltransferase n=1 Tax=Maribacter sp. LLG6340-A2 TaxID=3160834 RepID=UPI003863D2E8